MAHGVWSLTPYACDHCRAGEPITHCTCPMHISQDAPWRSGCMCWTFTFDAPE